MATKTHYARNIMTNQMPVAVEEKRRTRRKTSFQAAVEKWKPIDPDVLALSMIRFMQFKNGAAVDATTAKLAARIDELEATQRH